MGAPGIRCAAEDLKIGDEVEFDVPPRVIAPNGDDPAYVAPGTKGMVVDFISRKVTGQPSNHLYPHARVRFEYESPDRRKRYSDPLTVLLDQNVRKVG